MLDQSPAAPSPSSDILLEGDRKRRRKALSYIDCKCRKLRCNRQTPCGRCLKAGYAEKCMYGSEARQSAFVQEASTSAEEAEDIYLKDAQTRATTGTKDGILSKLLGQADKISELERGLSSLETLVKEAPLQSWGVGKFAAGRTPTESRASKGIETISFQGKGLNTQFNGATNPISPIAHVITSLKSRACLTDIGSFSKSAV